MENNYPTELPDFRLTKTHVKLLKHARKRIKEGLSEYVCLGIENGVCYPDAAGLNNHPKRIERAGANLRRFIRRALNGNTYFDTWQRRNGIYRSNKKVQKDRAKWVKYLLENTPRQ
jgi:hypothetical protein